MNERDLVTFEQAKKLKELGFKEECLYHYIDLGILIENYKPFEDKDTNWVCYNKYTSNSFKFDAPFLYQVQNWLREEKHIHITIDTYYPNWASNDWTLTYECIIIYLDKHLRDCLTYRPSTYEEALNYGINKVLEAL